MTEASTLRCVAAARMHLLPGIVVLCLDRCRDGFERKEQTESGPDKSARLSLAALQSSLSAFIIRSLRVDK